MGLARGFPEAVPLLPDLLWTLFDHPPGFIRVPSVFHPWFERMEHGWNTDGARIIVGEKQEKVGRKDEVVRSISKWMLRKYDV